MSPLILTVLGLSYGHTIIRIEVFWTVSIIGKDYQHQGLGFRAYSCARFPSNTVTKQI